jgi:hypothetical protein
MPTTVLAYVIAAVGLLMLIFGSWGLFVLNTRLHPATSNGC